jgi:hypothetical protein
MSWGLTKKRGMTGTHAMQRRTEDGMPRERITSVIGILLSSYRSGRESVMANAAYYKEIH